MAFSPAAADTAVTHDFEDGTEQGWIPRGTATLDAVEVGAEAQAGTWALAVTGRGDQTWHGPQFSVEAIDPVPETYTVEAYVRLAPGEADAEANLGIEAPGASNAYPWVGDRLPVTDDAWTHLSGTYTVEYGAEPAYINLEVTGVGVDYWVDSVTITATGEATPPPAAAVDVWNLDFDGDSFEPWTQSGDPVLSYVDDGAGGKALQITRSANYEGIESPVGQLEAGVVYSLSMRARLPEGETGPVDTRFVAVPGWSWLGNVQLTGSEWTEITATHVFTEEQVAEGKFYIGLGPEPDVTDEITVIVDDVLVTRPATAGEYTPVDMGWDFEDGTLQGWEAREAQGSPTVAVTSPGAGDSQYAALVTDRSGQGDGIRVDLSEVVEVGVTYNVTADVRLAEPATDTIVLQMQTGENSFPRLGAVENVSDGAWSKLDVTFSYAGGDMAYLYFESPWAGGDTGTTYDFMVDNITLVSQAPPTIEDLPSIHERYTDEFPIGIAIDRRETLGVQADLTTLHFNQITAENHMKVENWYDAERNFRIDPQAAELMDFAVANGMRVYGHALAWHSQTPTWFFQDDEGAPLTTSDEDKQVLRDRLRDHIFGVAAELSAWGEYGGDNPLVAWDVVNEVISDGPAPDGMRQSEWYRILGPEFVDLAFQYAEAAFNQGDFVADGADRPVTLFINDYNSEIADKQDRYFALVSDLVERDIPIDGVGHQFHVYMTNTVPSLESTIQRFMGLGLTQAVTELDVNIGAPRTDAKIVEQGYYYRDAFRMFREYSDELFSVSVWGLSDDRSWRSHGSPLLFDAELQAKPAYYGVIDMPEEYPLPDWIREANVYQGAVSVEDGAAEDVAWSQLPLHELESGDGFQARWTADALTVFVDVVDATVEATDGVEVVLGGTSYTIDRDGTLGEGVAAAVVEETDAGYTVVASLELAADVAEGDTVAADVIVTDGDATDRWASAETPGTLTLLGELPYTEVPLAPAAPAIDGDVEPVWAAASTVSTDTDVEGTDGASANVHTLWRDGTLYVLMDVTGADADSVEIFVDAGNFKHGPYRYEETNITITEDNTVSFGRGGDLGWQAARVESATAATEDGFVVEAAIDLLHHSGVGTFHGLEFQVNDVANGTVTSWANPTGDSADSSLRWGVAQLVEDLTLPFADVRPGHPFFDEIQWMWASGLTRGYEDGTFRSLWSVNRDAMAAFLYRVANGAGDAPACEVAPFTDVPTDHPFCGEIAWFKDQNITTGFPDGSFRPATPVTREAMAAFIFRMANPETDMPECEAKPFADVTTAHPFCGAIQWMKTEGLSTGWSDGTFRPGIAIERQAMAAFLYRAIVVKDVFAPAPEAPAAQGAGVAVAR